jgi:hypothetical protein
MSMKNYNDNMGNRTRDPPTCSAVPQPTALPRAVRKRRENEFSQVCQIDCYKNSNLKQAVRLDANCRIRRYVSRFRFL